MKKIHKTITQKQASAILRALKYHTRKRQAPVYRDENGKRYITKRVKYPEFVHLQNLFWNQSRDRMPHASIHQLARVARAAYQVDMEMMSIGSYYPGDDTAHMEHRKGKLVRFPGKSYLDNFSWVNVKDVAAVALLGGEKMVKIKAAREAFDRDNYQKFPDLDDLPEDGVIMAVPAERDIAEALEAQ